MIWWVEISFWFESQAIRFYLDIPARHQDPTSSDRRPTAGWLKWRFEGYPSPLILEEKADSPAQCWTLPLSLAHTQTFWARQWFQRTPQSPWTDGLSPKFLQIQIIIDNNQALLVKCQNNTPSQQLNRIEQMFTAWLTDHTRNCRVRQIREHLVQYFFRKLNGTRRKRGGDLISSVVGIVRRLPFRDFVENRVRRKTLWVGPDRRWPNSKHFREGLQY